MSSKKQVYAYIALLLLTSWIIQIAAIFVTGDVNKEEARIWLVVTMLSPMLVTIGFLYKYKELRDKFLWKPTSGIFIASFFAVSIHIVIAFLVLFIIQQCGYGQSEWFSFGEGDVSILGGPFVLGSGKQTWLVFGANLFVTGLLFAMLNAVVTTGEEFAWRGLLQPLLMERLGLIKGVALLGFIWSFWHLPVLLNGYNYPDNPVLGALVLFPVRLIATSYFYAWLTQKSKSFIPASIAHGALNGIQTGIVSNIKMNTGWIYENLITIGVTVLIGLLFLALACKTEKTQQS